MKANAKAGAGVPLSADIETDPVARLAYEKQVRDTEIEREVTPRDHLRDFRKKRRDALIDDVGALVQANATPKKIVLP
jgi:hypothetical protein